MEREEASSKEPGEIEWEIIDLEEPDKDEQKEGVLERELKQNNEKKNGIEEQENVKINCENEMDIEETEEVIEAIRQANKEMMEKLDKMREERNEEKESQLQREQECLRNTESWKMEQLKVEMEKEALKKAKEQVEKDKAEIVLQRQQMMIDPVNVNVNVNVNANDSCFYHMDISQCISPHNNLPKCESCKHCTTHLSNFCPKCIKFRYEHTNFLTVDGVLNDQEWSPCLEQKYGWILHNHSGLPLKFKVRLTRVGNERDITICEEDMLCTYEVDIDKEMEIVVHARAPSLCGKYTSCWRMVNEDKQIVGPPLEMKILVKSTLEESQEKAVSQMIVDFGFRDRETVVAVLSANKWNVSASVEELIEQANRV